MGLTHEGRHGRDAGGQGVVPDVVPEATRVLVADGDPLARQAICDLLRDAQGMLVIAEARDGVEAAELALHYRPEVVVSELRLAQLDAVAAMRRVHERAAGIAFIFLTGTTTAAERFACLRAGAFGVLSKEISPGALVRAVAGVAAGEAAVPREMADELVRRLQDMPRAGAGLRPIRSPLTPREWEVLDLLGAGHDHATIAALLGLAGETVHSHVKHLVRKLGVPPGELVAEADRLCRRHSRPVLAVAG